jgi:hypothetical protein
VTFLASGYLTAAIVAAIGMIALHVITRRPPRAVAFPTTRFVPDAPVAARARSMRISDLALLAVRVLTVLCAGAALARPVPASHRERVARVIAADISGSVASVAETRDSARALFRPGDGLVLFDTAARSVSAPDSIDTHVHRGIAGSLSAGLIAALREGSRIRDGADSVELVVVSPATGAEQDRATTTIRALWPGRARFVMVAAQAASPGAQREGDVRFLSRSRPAFAVSRSRIDTVGAVTAHGRVVIAPFERRWRYVPDSLTGSRVIARWVDGEPAAIARGSGADCVQSVAVPVDSSGDMLLRPSFLRFRAALAESCDAIASPPDAATAVMLAGTGQLAAASQFGPATGGDSALARWLAAAAIALAITDMILRRSRDTESEA